MIRGVVLSWCVACSAALAAEAVVDPAAALLAEVKAPAGFTATIFATPAQANYPVFVAATADGTLFVSSDGNGSLGRDPGRGRILRLRDADGDGIADEVKEFVKRLDSPRGLVWVDDQLIVLHPPHVTAFRDTDGDGLADDQAGKRLVSGIAFDYSKRPADHTSNGLALGVDGWIYAAIGDFGFLAAEGSDGRTLQLRGGGIVRFRPDGSGLDLFARGTRNTLEAAVGPLLDMIARDNTNDGGGWNVRLHAFTGLEDHGYPRRYMHFADEIVAPLADYGGGSGTGACWIDEPWMPADVNDAPFTCDWGAGKIFRHPLTSRGAGYEAKQEPFITIPRATDLDVDAVGNLYAASWRGGTFSWTGPEVGFITRLRPASTAVIECPDFMTMSRRNCSACSRARATGCGWRRSGRFSRDRSCRLHRPDLNRSPWMPQPGSPPASPPSSRSLSAAKQRLLQFSSGSRPIRRSRPGRCGRSATFPPRGSPCQSTP